LNYSPKSWYTLLTDGVTPYADRRKPAGRHSISDGTPSTPRPSNYRRSYVRHARTTHTNFP
ncbi:Protein disulfide-isomerase A6, partial [Branchiostoma belcheri]